jgi:hypothetical protein
MKYGLWVEAVKVKVKCSCYRPGAAKRVGRGIALLFHDHVTRRGVSGQQHALAALYSRERPGTHFTGGWVGGGSSTCLYIHTHIYIYIYREREREIGQLLAKF